MSSNRIHHQALNQQGFVLVVALVVLLMQSVLMGALMYRSGTEMKLSTQWEDSQDAFSAAEIGVEEGQRFLLTEFGQRREPTATVAVPTNGCADRIALATHLGNGLRLARNPGQPVSLSTVNAQDSMANLFYQYFVAPIDPQNPQAGTGIGANVGVSQNYRGGGAATTLYYRIWSCGFGAQLTPLRVVETTVSSRR